MPKHSAETVDTIEWRRIGRHLWVAASEDGPLGVVEQGFRFKVIDVVGNVVGRARTLVDAQQLLSAVAGSRDAARGDAGAADNEKRAPGVNQELFSECDPSGI